MNYKESKQILEEIKKAKRILVNCHRRPDPDSIGSALALYRVLKNMGKDVGVYCPSERLDARMNYLKDYLVIKKGVNFSEIDYSEYDLMITLDSSSWDMVTGDKEVGIPEIKKVVIDHHKTNTRYGEINLVDGKIGSVGELLYLIFEDWDIKPNKEVANYLMAAIVGDTGAFRFPGTTERTFRVASALLELGADKDEIIHHYYRSEPFELIKFLGEVLMRAKIDKKYKFAWSAIPYDVYEKLGKPHLAKESAASTFAQVVEGTDFGFVALEHEKNKLTVSFRSRTGFDTSRIAVELGGGGHVYASGGSVEGLPFKEAVDKVLEVTRRYAKKD